MTDARVLVSIRLKQESIDAIQQLADAERRTRSDMTRVLILEAMDARKAKAAR